MYRDTNLQRQPPEAQVGKQQRNGFLLLRVGFSQQLSESAVLSYENNSKCLFIQIYDTSNWFNVAVLNARAQTKKAFSMQLPTVVFCSSGLCYLELKLPNHAVDLESIRQHS